MSITIIKPGVSCSIQDLGRWGYQQFGVPIGGAMDTISATTANRICGNDDDEAVLECTLHGLEMKCNETISFALTGGGARATINGETVAYNRLIKVVAGSILKLHPDPHGCRTYIAIAGGLKIEKELGSASTYASSLLGGYKGRNLEAGDELALKKNNIETDPSKDIIINENGFGISKWKAQVTPFPHLQDVVEINCEKGPEWELFDVVSQEIFFNQPFTIAPQSNRMGYRLDGVTLSLKEKTELISTAVTRGIIQVTNEGHPIILMADAQTIGGYPRIARVSSKDISPLAQCRPGMRVRFKINLQTSL
jgi:antagonist of KipI